MFLHHWQEKPHISLNITRSFVNILNIVIFSVLHLATLFFKPSTQSPKTSVIISDYSKPIHLFLFCLLRECEFLDEGLKKKKKKSQIFFCTLIRHFIGDKYFLTSWFSKQRGVNYSESNPISPKNQFLITVILQCFKIFFRQTIGITMIFTLFFPESH